MRGASSKPRCVGAGALALLAGSTLASCSGEHSVMNPKTTEGNRIAGIAWTMFAIAAAVLVVVVGLMVIGIARRPRREHHGLMALPSDRRWIIGGGVLLPFVVILLLSGLTVWALAEDRGAAQLTISVTAHQYWWEVRYEGSTAVTANEFHIPTSEEVRLLLRSDDVVHSLWVPELGPKRDMIPGRLTDLMWRANDPGTFRGQCAEFCGLQHANMALIVTAEPRPAFDAWLAGQAADAPAPTNEAERAGLAAFLAAPCSSCHTIRGTPATGTAGPDLTHLASRSTIGAGVAPLDRGHLAGWIVDSQALKPGNLMPRVALSPDDLQSMLAYLEARQ